MNAIEVRGLTKAYRDFTLDGLSFELPEGCILGLVGENGAGKTTHPLVHDGAAGGQNAGGALQKLGRRGL